MHPLTPSWYKPRTELLRIDNITEVIGTGIDNIKIVENFLSQKEVDIAMSVLSEHEVNYAATHSYPLVMLPNHQPSEQEISFAKFMGDKMVKTGEALYGLDLIKDQGFQYITHPTGTYIDPHTDILDIDDPDYENDSLDEQIERFPYLWSGHLSILAYLNDDYEGGELYFPELNFGIKPKVGMLILFPGSLHYVHGVAPITSGVRYTLSQWCRFKDFKAKI